MAELKPVLGPDALNAFLARAFPGGDAMPLVTAVEPGAVVLEQRWLERMLRPGGVISGPTLMSLADTAAYALVLAHIGVQPMAVTSGLTINFLARASRGR
jgi:acyl-coenzyme A thioesterase PaaI-like protein